MAEKQVTPMDDRIFKALFGNDNKKLLTGFLSALLTDVPKEDIAELQILNAARNIRKVNEKASIVDLRIKTKSGKMLSVEMQKRDKSYFKNRSLFHVCDMYVSQIDRDNPDYEVEETIVVLLCDFILEKELRAYHNIARLHYDQSTVRFSEGLTVHTLELKKLPRVCDGTALWHYLKFLKSEKEEDLEMVSEEMMGIKEAKEQYRRLRADKELMEIIRQEDDELYTRNTMILHARREGKAQGIEQGIEQGTLAVAKTMLAAGSSIDYTVQVTGLPKEKILSFH